MKREVLNVTPIAKKWISTRELCKYLDCSDDFIQSIRDKERLIYTKLSSKLVLYDINSVERYLRRHSNIYD